MLALSDVILLTLITLMAVALAAYAWRRRGEPSAGPAIGSMMVGADESGQRYSEANLRVEDRLRRQSDELTALRAELRAAKEQAEAATRAKSAFLAHMSHDMRTSISSAIGMAELLRYTSLDAQQREMVDIIRTSGNTLLELLNTFLDLARIEAGRLTLEQQPFDLQSCIEDAIDLMVSQVVAKQLDLAYTLAPDTPAILIGDQPRLRQILVNLLSNAAKFTNTGGIFLSVAVRSRFEQRCEVHFSVADTGAGIPAAQIEKIFDSFQQLDNTSVHPSLGTGLGLAIGRGLSEAMGGRMWVESVLGSGSTFHFTIVADALPESIHGQPAKLTELAGKHMLIVDRHMQSRLAISLYAQSVGMRVSATSSALEALEWAGEGVRFDVAVADIRDANGDAGALGVRLREHFGMPELPMIQLALLGMQDIQNPSDEPGLLLRKPLKLSRLQEALLRLLASQQHADRPEMTSHENEMRRGEKALPRILLAEDDRANQQLGLRILQKLGYPHEAVRTGEQVLAAIEREPYDIVLLDVQLPDIDGLEVARRIGRRSRDRWQPYLIAITAGTLPGAREACLSAGMSDYLTKPLQIEELQAALERYHQLVSTPATDAEEMRSRAVGASAHNSVSVPPGSGPLDVETLDRVRALFGPRQREEYRNLIESYMKDSDALLTKMYAASAARNQSLLQQATHQLKSSSAVLAALPLANLCARFEQAMSTSTTDIWDTWIQRIDAEFRRVKAALEQELRS